MKNPTFTHSYNLHGIQLAISSDMAVARALESRLEHFATANSARPDLTFEFETVPRGASHHIGRPSQPTRPVYDPPLGEVVYAEEGDGLYINYDDRVRVRCDATAGQVWVSSLDDTQNHLWLLSHPLFTLPLAECLKRRGLYALHAAALARAGQCLLVAGTSGAGKSTLTVALLRAGLDFLGDDMLFLRRGPTGLEALAFPEEIDVTEQTVGLFPELAAILQLPQAKGWRKRQVRAESVSASQIVMAGKPRALLFPRVANADRSVLEPMTAEEAFMELVPNVLLTERVSSQAHLDVLAELAKQTLSYRLETGRDLKALAVQLCQLVEQ